MKEAKNIIDAWASESRMHWTGKHFRVDNDHLIPRMVVAIDNVMDDLAKSKGDQFCLDKSRAGRTVVKCSPLAMKLIECARTCDLAMVRQYLSRHKFSPYFEAFERCWDRFSWMQGPIGADQVPWLNRWIGELRNELKASPFRKLIERQRRSANKNAASLRRFIQAMFRGRAKILVIRVDLGYHAEAVDDSVAWEPPTDLQVKEHLQQWLRHVRSVVPGKPRIVWKLEWGAVKGFHVHAMILCRGDEVREGISWGEIVGEAWKEITSRAGTYWNCNANFKDFMMKGICGIGPIHANDHKSRLNLCYRVVGYLCKTDQYFKPKCALPIKRIRKGEEPEIRPIKLGRPVDLLPLPASLMF